MEGMSVRTGKPLETRVLTVNGDEPKKPARKRQTRRVSTFFATAQGMLKMANKA